MYGVPQAQFLDKVVDMPVASMTGAWGCQCRKLRHPQLQCCGVDVPVVQVVDWVSAGGASNSVHRQISWTFQYAQRQGGLSAGFGGDVGLGIFRAPPGRP